MAVVIMDRDTGKVTRGKYAKRENGQVYLYTGIMRDKSGGWRGCGKRLVFPDDQVTVQADEPAKELHTG